MANTTPKNDCLKSFSQRDLNCIWHPFTQASTAPPPIPIIRGEGAYLYAEDGSRYIDAISSWWVNLHGHAHPYIAKKISEQAHILEQVIFADFTHQKAIELGERLVKLLPGNMAKIFFTDNGSTAVEAALKMAIQFWHNQNLTLSKTKVISFKGGYHGDTFGAMSAAGCSALNESFWPFLFDSITIDPPEIGKEEVSLNQMKKILEDGRGLCFIFEPLIQGTGGMKVHSREGLDALVKLCKEYDIISIADEVMTGFGRTGSLFACDTLKYKPDIMCLSKGLTGGFLPLGVTACTKRIFNAFLSENKSKAFLHGHSYCANPLACSAALSSLDLLETSKCFDQRKAIESFHFQFKNAIGKHPKLIRVEVIGTILAVEYKSETETSYFNKMRDKLYYYFLSKKILLRPLGNVVYILPPYCIEENDLKEIYQTILLTLEEKW